MRDLSILIIDDDPLIQATISKILKISNPHYYIETAGTVNEAITLIKKTYWDTILLDLCLPKNPGEIPHSQNGLQALNIFKKEFKLTAPIIAITGHFDDELSDIVLDEGAYYFLHKPLRPKSLSAIIKNAASFQLSGFDGLTGLLNKKTFQERLKSEFERIKRRNQEIEQFETKSEDNASLQSYLSVIFFDGDNFKKINDTYNHLIGDQVLKKIGSMFMDENLYRIHDKEQDNYKFIIRPYDIAARFGGDEFSIFLPETNHENALIVAKRIKHLLENYNITSLLDHNDDLLLSEGISLSIGLATYPLPNSAETYIDLIEQADAAMYASKGKRTGEIFGYDQKGKIIKLD